MARPNRSDERREELLPVLVETFVERGYRRTTTAELARRTELQENQLYRLWPDKRAMFVAALDHVYRTSEETWAALAAESPGDGTRAERLIAHEARHHGEHGLYRIVFAGLSETDDPVVARALKRLYGRFQRFVVELVEEHREETDAAGVDPALAAWSLIGLGTVANIGRELGLVSARTRRALFENPGRLLLGPLEPYAED